MGFFSTARHEGAKVYGAARAEKYGRQEKWFRVIVILGFAGFLFYCWLIGR